MGEKLFYVLSSETNVFNWNFIFWCSHLKMDTPDSSKNFSFFCQKISGRLEKMTILLPWHNMTSRQKKKKNYHSLLDKKSRLLLKVNNLIFNQLEIIFALLHVHVAYFLYIIYTLRIQLPMQSVPITTNVVRSNTTQTGYNNICDKVHQWLATGWWFSLGTLASSTNKTCLWQDIT